MGVYRNIGGEAARMDMASWEGLDALLPGEARRMVFRGKNLGSSFTEGQKEAVADGSFKGLFLGDYWEIDGRVWRIADFDYWWNTGDTACTTHHLVVMPDDGLYNAKMNETDTTEGGYIGSKMRTENLEQAKTIINNAFGSGNVLNHREFLSNAVTNGCESGIKWVDSTAELPNEIMTYGCYVFKDIANGMNFAYKHTVDKQQLALTQAVPKFIRPYFALRDVCNGTDFAIVGDGVASNGKASGSRPVRPVFGLKGTD